MKKFLFLSFLIYLVSNNTTTFGTELKEEILDVKGLPEVQSSYDREERKQRQEETQQQAEQDGMDYMYRMQQQMMRGNNWNQFGGYRY